MVSRQLLTAIALSAVFVAAAAFTMLAERQVYADTDANVTVNVTISGMAEITVNPTFLSFSLQPGQASTAKLIDITNTGSYNVTQMHVFTDTLQDESTRPYGSSTSQAYASGGVIVIHNSTDLNTTNYFAGRLEWNSTSDVSNKNLANINTPTAFGFFRNTSYEYFWGLGNGSAPTHAEGLAGQCNNTGAQFGIDSDVDNGTTASRTPETGIVSAVQPASDWGMFSVSASPLTGYCVAAYYDCSKIYIYKYDKRTNPNFGLCSNSNYFQLLSLVSGNTHTMTMNAYAPNGIPDGALNTSTVTVYVTSV